MEAEVWGSKQCESHIEMLTNNLHRENESFSEVQREVN